MSKIKICGITDTRELAGINAAKPDYFGFIFAANRRRTVTLEQAKELRNGIDSSIPSVGVFVNEPVEQILSFAESGVFSLIQLHGKADFEKIVQIKSRVSLPVIQAYAVTTVEEMSAAQQCPADYLLFDYGIGGTGQSFDWTLLSHNSRPYFLAGGIGLNNISQAITLAPDVIDVSSGAETNGKKDPEKVIELVRRVRNGV